MGRRIKYIITCDAPECNAVEEYFEDDRSNPRKIGKITVSAQAEMGASLGSYSSWLCSACKDRLGKRILKPFE